MHQPFAPEPFFLAMQGGARGQRFCLLHPPMRGGMVDGRVRSAIVHVHPFAEEMNKSRRMVALQARALARDGHAVLQIDLLGCGDSSGDFGDATWHDWTVDVAEAARFMQSRYDAPLWLWGLRAGCLVAAQSSGLLSVPCNFLFWQAPSSGKTILQQFLRLKAAADMLGGAAKGATAALQAQLAAGHAVDVAGYSVGPALARGLEEAVLLPPKRPGRLEWIDLSTRPEAVATPAAERTLGQWRDAGFAVQGRTVVGPAFWQTTEIETVPALIDATCRAMAATEVEGVPA